MKWHAQRVRCSVATILRGYRKGSYAKQSPYQALMLIVSRAGRSEVQGFLSDRPLTPKDFRTLRIAGQRLGICAIRTRRKGRLVEIR